MRIATANGLRNAALVIAAAIAVTALVSLNLRPAPNAPGPPMPAPLWLCRTARHGPTPPDGRTPIVTGPGARQLAEVALDHSWRRTPAMAHWRALLRPFTQVDVFTTVPYGGNPVAVVLDGSGLSTEDMQRFARWTNLSETTFVLPPTSPNAHYRARIFTPSAELPFAGHPTLGTCHAWLAHRQPEHEPDVVVQECGAGPVLVRRSRQGLAFAAPPLVRSGPVDDEWVQRIAGALGIERARILDSQWVDNGPGWVAALLGSAEEVIALRPGHVGFDLGVVGPYPAGSPEAFEVRAFFPHGNATVEDPVTGSLNASLADWLLRTGRVEAPYVVRQGTVLGRAGRVHIARDSDGTIWVGGGAVTCITGQVDI